MQNRKLRPYSSHIKEPKPFTYIKEHIKEDHIKKPKLHIE